jgi:hypothetical protein
MIRLVLTQRQGSKPHSGCRRGQVQDLGYFDNIETFFVAPQLSLRVPFHSSISQKNAFGHDYFQVPTLHPAIQNFVPGEILSPEIVELGMNF